MSLRGAGGAQRIADRDQRAEHDQDRPFDMLIGLAHRQRAGRSSPARPPRRRRLRPGHSRSPSPPSRRRGSRSAASRACELPSAAARSASGSAAEIAQPLGQQAQRPLQHDHVAGAQRRLAELLGQPLAAPRHRDQVDAVALAAAAAAPRSARSAASRCSTTASITPTSSSFSLLRRFAILRRRARACRRAIDPFEHIGLAAEDQHVVLAQPGTGTRRAAHAGAQQRR